MIRLKSCKRDGQRLAITLVDGDREESVWLGPQSVGSAFIQQESNAQELAKVIVEAVNALQKPMSIEAQVALARSLGSDGPPVPNLTPAQVKAPETEPVVVPAKPTKRSGK